MKKHSSELMGSFLYLIFAVCVANFMIAVMVKGITYCFNANINLETVSFLLSSISIISGFCCAIYAIIHYKKLIMNDEKEKINEEDLERYKEYKEFVVDFETKYPNLINDNPNLPFSAPEVVSDFFPETPLHSVEFKPPTIAPNNDPDIRDLFGDVEDLSSINDPYVE